MYKLALKNLLRPGIMKMFISAEGALLGRYDAATPAGGEQGFDQLQHWLSQGGRNPSNAPSAAADQYLMSEGSKMTRNLHCFAG